MKPLNLHTPLWLASAESVRAQRRRASERRQRRLFPILCLAAVAVLVWLANFIVNFGPSSRDQGNTLGITSGHNPRKNAD